MLLASSDSATIRSLLCAEFVFFSVFIFAFFSPSCSYPIHLSMRNENEIESIDSHTLTHSRYIFNLFESFSVQSNVVRFSRKIPPDELPNHHQHPPRREISFLLISRWGGGEEKKKKKLFLLFCVDIHPTAIPLSLRHPLSVLT